MESREQRYAEARPPPPLEQLSISLPPDWMRGGGAWLSSSPRSAPCAASLPMILTSSAPDNDAGVHKDGLEDGRCGTNPKICGVTAGNGPKNQTTKLPV